MLCRCAEYHYEVSIGCASFWWVSWHRVSILLCVILLCAIVLSVFMEGCCAQRSECPCRVLFAEWQVSVILSVILLSVIMPIANMQWVIILSVDKMRTIVLSVRTLSAIRLNAITLSVNMLFVFTLSADMPFSIMLSIIMQSVDKLCHYA